MSLISFAILNGIESMLDCAGIVLRELKFLLAILISEIAALSIILSMVELNGDY
jgi:hypothetical protein